MADRVTRCSRCGELAQHSHSNRPSAARRGYGNAWRVIRADHLRVEPFCPCGAQATDVDHILARRKGGTDDHANLKSLCHRHHSMKTARLDGGFGNRTSPTQI